MLTMRPNMSNAMSVKVVFVFIFSLASTVESSNTKFACEGKTLALSCKAGEHLDVVKVDFGRSIATICKHEAISNLNCHSQTAEAVVKKLCEKKQSCKIAATTQLFGDPCPNTFKFLEVKYKCKPVPECAPDKFRCEDGSCLEQNQICNGLKECPNGEDEHLCKYQTIHVCEGQELAIECPAEDTITVVRGEYGRTDKGLCSQNHNANTNCVSNEAHDKLIERCDMKPSCTATVNNHLFGDPCPGTSKYASLHYFCGAQPEIDEE